MGLDLRILWDDTRALGPALGPALGAIAVLSVEIAGRSRGVRSVLARLFGAVVLAAAVYVAAGAAVEGWAARWGRAPWVGGVVVAALGALAALVGRDRGGSLQACAFVALLAGLVGLVHAPAVRAVFAGATVVDGLGMFLAIVVLVAAGMAVLMAPQYLAARAVEPGEFYGLLLLSTAGAAVLAQAADLVTLFLALEIMSVPVYVLVGITRRDGRSVEAAMKYFIAGSFASAALLFGMALVFGATSGTGLGTWSEVPEHATRWFYAGWILLLAGVLFKIGAAPFHPWVPDAYEGAPLPVTAFMAVGVKAAGFGALLRIVPAARGVAGGAEWTALLAAVSVATMAVGNLMALAQSSVKRMLAYSSIAHTGYALVAVCALAAGLGTRNSEVAREALASAAFYMVAYGFMTLGAFAFLAMVPRAAGERETYEEMDGLAARRPWAALAMALFMVSLAGMPPTAGFIAKFWVLRAVVAAGGVWLAVVAVVATVVSFAYYLRVAAHLFMRSREGAEPVAVDPNAGWAVALCAIFTLMLGVWPALYGVRAVEAAARALF